jgi:peptidoglycan/LPS O-acetylase OafA/YrhL/lysophospholipase L1-like esterase
VNWGSRRACGCWYRVRAPVTDSSSPRSRFSHVPALDGLRGLALLGVLLFHADGALPGGYLGVDLFFVLSGYLITALLVAEQRDTGRIDLYGFWARRFRRLLPALLSLIPAIAIYGKFFAAPEELRSLRDEALASLAYVANWRAIWSHKSYWELFSAPSPLEHTWSLSIEEQFYVVWPLVAAWLLKRRGERALLWLSVVLTLLSALAMLLVFSPADSSRAYLGTDTRMAAILAGAAFAIVWPPGRALAPAQRRWLDRAGIAAAALLAVAWCFLRGNNPWLYRGGFWLTELLVLVLIACAVSGKDSAVARALSLRPLTWLGSVSYGVYLWHWPVNVVLSAERIHVSGLGLQALRLAITFAIAIVSYRYLEQPIRRHGFPFARPQYVLPAAVTLAALLIVHSTDARAGEPSERRPGDLAQGDVSQRIVVFGDSTANSIGWGLRGLQEPGLQVDLLGKDGCSLLRDSCNGEHWAEEVRKRRPDATLVYVGGAFLHGFDAAGAWRTACYPEWDEKLEQALTRRLAELASVPSRVFAVTAPYPLGRYDSAEYRAQIDCINASVRKAAQTVPSVSVLDLHEQLCPHGACRRELPNRKLLRPDGVHFSLEGGTSIAPQLLAQIRD